MRRRSPGFAASAASFSRTTTELSSTKTDRIRSCSTIPACSSASTNGAGSSRRSRDTRARRLCDDAIVNPHAGEGGQDVLGHFDRGIALSDRCAARRGNDPIDPGGDPWSIGQVDPLEYDARAGIGRTEANRDV